MSRALLLALLLGAAPAIASAETVAITNARIETAGPAGEIASGTVVIKDGKIAAVGAGVAAPAGARVIDAKGQVLSPGVIAASTSLGAREIGGVQSTHDDTAGSEIGAGFDMAYSVNPASATIPVAREAGVTRAVVTPASSRGGEGGDEDFDSESLTAGGGDKKSPGAGLFDGQAAVIHTASAEPDIVLKSKVAVVLEFGDSGARTAGSRGAWVVLMKEALEDARAFQKNRSAFERGETASHLARADLEALVPVAEGRTPLLVRVHRASDIRLILRLAREEHLKLILEGAEEAWMVAPELAAAGVPVLIDSEADLPESFESLGARLDNAARLQSAGVLFGILGARDFDNVRQARFNAGTAVANGLPYAAAIAAVTANPAKIWGFGDKSGSIEVGKDADLVLWSGDPLETSTWPTAVFVAGRQQPQDARILKLRDRYAKPSPDGYPWEYH